MPARIDFVRAAQYDGASVSNNPLRPGQFAGILLCFFLSGAAGLIYQVAWGKALGLVFGHTVYAIATVLAVFMGGLALGSAYWGRWSEHSANPVRLYGWMEMAIAAGGALSLAGLAGVRWLYLQTYPLVAGSVPALLLLRFAGSALVLLLPTFLMGGTLPVLVQGVTRTSAELGRRVSRLYWVNTLGAVGGTLAAGFLLLPWLGQRLTVGVAVALNLFAGAVALALSVAPASGRHSSGESTPQNGSTPNRASAPPLSSFLLASFALVGGTAIAYEIGWTRLLATYLGSSTYAFTLMLATFLAGIVIGSLLFEAWMARGRVVTSAGYAATQTLTAIAAFGFLLFYQQFPTLLGYLLRATHDTFGGLVLAQCIISALAMLPTAIIFGFNFPLVTVLIAGRKGEQQADSSAGAAVGRAYAANTLGAIISATSVGFFVMPRIGAFRLLAITAAANLSLALLLRLREASRRWLAAALNAALLAAVCIVLFSGAYYRADVATFAAVMYYDIYGGKLSAAEQAATTDIIFAEDGLNATISVAKSEDYVAERTNGKVDASNKDTLTQYMAGHLGMMFHSAPRRVLVIGFGSGMTVASVARYPDVEHIDCVEIEPAVLHAAPYLEQLNRGVPRDPRVRIIFDDARNYLLTTREQYDLIISEPSNPWIAGVSALFTDEFYAEARGRLRPGGMLVQWVQGYSLFPEDFRMVLSTFVPHFPRVTLWRGEAPDFLLLAQTDLRPLRLERLRRMWSNEGLQTDYDALNIEEPEGVLSFHRLDDVDLRRLVEPELRNTDDNSRLEFRAPRALLSRGLDEKNIEMVWTRRTSVLPRDVVIDDPRGALRAAAETDLLNDDNDGAEYFMKPLEDSPPDYELELLRGRIAYALENYGGAHEHFTTALHLDPSSLRAATGLADVARNLNQLDNAELLYRQVLGRNPKYVLAYVGIVDVLRTRANWAEAAKWQAARLDVETNSDVEETARLGELLLRAGEPDLAEKTLLSALEREPYCYLAHRNLADIYRARKDWEKAVENFEFVVRYEPDADPLVYTFLAAVYRETGKSAKAAAILRKGLRLFPDNAALKSSVQSH
jgi:spermidine synthase